MKKLMALSTILILLTGCRGLARLAREMKGDPAIVAVRVGSPWGMQTLTRVGGSTNSVEVLPDGTVRINQK